MAREKDGYRDALDSMPQTATALKKTLAPRRVGGQQ